MGKPTPESTITVEAFDRALVAAGHRIGETITFQEFHCEPWDPSLPEFARDIVRQHFHAIVTTGSTLTTALKAATAALQSDLPVTQRTPIVMTTDDGDCVGAGLAASLEHSETNITGFTSRFSYLSGTRLAMLSELCDGLASAGVLWNPDVTDKKLDWQLLQETSDQLGTRLLSLEIRQPADIPGAFARAQAEQVRGLVFLGDGLTFRRRRQLVALSLESGLPAVFEHRAFVELGGLLAYGPYMPDLYGRAGAYLDQILRGVSPAELPIGKPPAYEAVVNAAAAQQLGLQIPSRLAEVPLQVVTTTIT